MSEIILFLVLAAAVVWCEFRVKGYRDRFEHQQLKFIRARDGVTANGKFIRNNWIMWFLGHIAPGVFGRPFHFRGTLRAPDGSIKQVVHVLNAVTSAGTDGIADQILATPTLNKPTHMAVGTGTGGTTTLTTELDRNVLTSKTRAGSTVTMVGDWAAGDATGALTEAGVFDAAAAGNMWLYTTFAVVNKNADDTFSIDWDLSIA